MSKYANGKIYTIRCRSDDTLIYVGSTTQKLSQRLAKHRSDCKRGICYSLYDYIENNDWTDFYIELYEIYPSNSKEELLKKEGDIIRQIGTINKRIAGRTDKEWREDNAVKIKEKVKEYKKDNVDKIKEKNKKYREENADKIKENKKEKVCCNICGDLINKYHLTKHQKSKKCMSKIPNNIGKPLNG